MNDSTASPQTKPSLFKNVIRLGWVSGLTDVSSEMLYAITPIFLTEVLKASVATVGWIEGIAEGTASILKGLSGWYSDRIRKRKPFVLVGYSLSAVAKPLIAVAAGWPLVLIARFFDRFGKGIRTSPRDALIAASSAGHERGRAFGLHRAMDTTGALVGVAISLGLLMLLRTTQSEPTSIRMLYWIAFIPALAGVLMIARVEEVAVPISATPRRTVDLRFGKRFYGVLGLFAVMSLGLSSDAFLLLRTREAGWSTEAMIGAYLCYNASFAVLSYPIGRRSDRMSKEILLGIGLLVYAAVYLGFAVLPSPWLVWPLFILYGLYSALTDGVSKALISNVISQDRLASAMGLFHMITGFMTVIASVVAGWMWDQISVAAPFYLGAILAAIGGIGFLLWRPTIPASAE
jgi:MFS family permease